MARVVSAGVFSVTDAHMLFHRSAGLALALTLVMGSAYAQGSSSADLGRCTVAALPTAGDPCEPQSVRLGVSGAEVVSDMGRPGDSRMEIATFDVNGIAVTTPGERMVVQLPDANTNVAAGEVSPEMDVTTTGSVASDGTRQ